MFGAGDVPFYLIAFLIGIFTGLAEIISRYRDEPTKALCNRYGLFYLLLNGILASVALFVLYRSEFFRTKDLNKLMGALTAGFGAMLIMRTKFFNLRTEKGEEYSFGPDIVISSFLRYFDRQIDRNRAIRRIALVKRTMTDVDFDKAHQYVSFLIVGSMQSLTEKEEEELGAETRRIEESDLGAQEKSYALGFVILDYMGEDGLAGPFKELKDIFPIESAPVARAKAREQTHP